MARTFQSAAAAIALMGVLTASPAMAAAAVPQTLNPMVALSAFGTAQSRAALCATGASSAAAAAATAAQAAAPGCVLPVVDAPPPVVSSAPPPPPMAPAAPAAFNAFPLLLGLAGIAAAVLLFRSDNDGRIVFELVSPQ